MTQNDKHNDLGGYNTQAAIVASLAHHSATASSEPKVGKYADAAPYVVLRDSDGKEHVEFLKTMIDAPARKTGIVKLNDAESFITFFGIHGGKSPVYAGLEPAQFVAVLNDHTAEGVGYRDHRALYVVTHSPEWNMWTKHNGAGAKFDSTESFALFVEENALDIVKPDASKMLEIALNFKINSAVKFSAAQRLQDGNTELAYSNVVDASATGAGGKIRIPENFTIEIPVFAALNPKKYKIDARFRFRLRDNVLSLWYELIHPRKAREQAFKDLWKQIEGGTKTTLLHGTPE